MKKKTLVVLMAMAAAAVLTVGCGAGSNKGTEVKTEKKAGSEAGSETADKAAQDSGEGVTSVKWLTSRPVDGAIDQTMREIAEQYSKEKGGNWQIEIETTADRPSYLQKLKTLIAGGNMPDIIDIDADPYCKELVEAGMLVDVKKFL